MFEYCVVQAGIDPLQFYLLTPFELRCLVARHLFSVARNWEQTRLISYTFIASNLKKGKTLSMIDYLPLLTDNFTKEVVEPLSNEKMQELIERDKRIKNALKNT